MKVAQNIVKRLAVTEKSSRLSATANQYVLEVAPDANKLEIKKAVESLFKVKVTGVRTYNRASRTVRDRRNRPARLAGCKRAIVTLQAGDKIDLT